MTSYEVAVIGAGPIGGHIAQKIASNGHNVIIIESKKEIGIPIKCAGLVTERVFEIANISKNQIIQNHIKGANIHSPLDKTLSIGGDKIHAVAINRTIFDKKIIEKAVKSGANLLLENKVLSVQKTNGKIEIQTTKKQNIKCDIVIGADGPYSTIRDRFGISFPVEMLRGIGAEIEGTNLNPNFVEIFTGKNIAPGFFAWAIPTNKDGTKARIGLCISPNAQSLPKYYFKKFLENKKHKKS